MSIRPADHGVLASQGGAVAPRAWGGLISQYESGGTTYRVHTFRGSGEFEVASNSIDLSLIHI